MEIESQEQSPGVVRRSGLALKAALYLIPLLFGLVYWLAFYPGVLSYDSVNQWDQLSRLHINDWHPASSTILMWLLTRLWYSPAVISLFQVMIASLVIGYGLNSIHGGFRIPAWLLVVLAVLVSANPLVGIVNITLWKDVLYGYMVLLITIFIFNIVKTNGAWIVKPVHFILFGCTLASIYLSRFNGFPVVIASVVGLFLVYRKYFKPLVFSTLVALVIVILVIGPLFSLFSVDQSLKQTYGMPFINPVVAYVSTNTALGSLSSAEKNYLDLIYPLDQPWPYSCYDATVFYYQDTNFYPVIQHPLTMVKIFARLALQSPLTALKHFACLSSFIWQPGQPRGVYLETVLFDSFNPDQAPGWSAYQNIIRQNPVLPTLHNLLQRLVQAEWRRDISMLLWRPALYMYAFLVGVILLVARTRLPKWLLLAVPLVAQSVVVMFTAQLQALRYQYPVYLISMLFTVPLIIVAIRNPNQLSVPEI